MKMNSQPLVVRYELRENRKAKEKKIGNGTEEEKA